MAQPPGPAPSPLSSITTRRVLIVGGGAIGGVVAARLADAGVPVTVLDINPALTERISSAGLRVEDATGTRDVVIAAATDAASLPPADVVVVCVKGYDTLGAIELFAPCVMDNTTIVSIQNGYGHADAVIDRFGADRVVLGVTYNSATVVGLAEVRQTGHGQTILGSAGADLARAESVVELFNAAGLDSRSDRHVRREIWNKLVFNAATLPTAAITGLTAGELARPGEMLELVDKAAREAVQVANAYGYDLDGDERLSAIHDVLPKVGAGKASMLQDHEAGRLTEIDYITGAVVRGAREHGIHTPVNDCLLTLIRATETKAGLR
jgi:2-dehydropantoate 2-reductase